MTTLDIRAGSTIHAHSDAIKVPTRVRTSTSEYTPVSSELQLAKTSSLRVYPIPIQNSVMIFLENFIRLAMVGILVQELQAKLGTRNPEIKLIHLNFV
ncbi:hypothetical protein HYALB_00009892 [Hymenoscyphus albidus]|uniref:Uncharacterized protein n=1 Tax=Hymenoscyphus albidus TaxID=595503 RepID=A0A9N9M3N4_9HELO|nr:hypothetical protein HYALB_00009892 [Hymenoscyphus albidus]